MKLLYLLNQRLPTEKAYGLQIAKMCSNFARLENVKLELLYPSGRNQIKESIFEYYGIKEAFKVDKIWTPYFYLPGRLEIIAFSIKSIISALILAREALSRNPDFIYSRDELPLYLLSFFRRNLVFEAHKMQTSRTFMYRRLMKSKIKLVVITNSLKDRFVELGFDVKNILVASDGVDTEVINQEENKSSNKESARNILNLSLGKKLVVYTGSLFRWKGVYILADAAKLLPEVLFIVVGGDERGDEKELRDYLDRNNIRNVTVTGYIKSEETVRSYLVVADVLILPNSAKDKVSQKYTSPLKLFEYMASRRPIVASDLPSLREILNENNSILVKPDDALALAEGIKKILGNSALSGQISNLAFEDVKQYTWEKRVQSVIIFIGK